MVYTHNFVTNETTNVSERIVKKKERKGAGVFPVLYWTISPVANLKPTELILAFT
jgi:hypothetical protein